jgi:hypothetical protein
MDRRAYRWAGNVEREPGGVNGYLAVRPMSIPANIPTQVAVRGPVCILSSGLFDAPLSHGFRSNRGQAAPYERPMVSGDDDEVGHADRALATGKRSPQTMRRPAPGDSFMAISMATRVQVEIIHRGPTGRAMWLRVRSTSTDQSGSTARIAGAA